MTVLKEIASEVKETAMAEEEEEAEESSKEMEGGEMEGDGVCSLVGKHVVYKYENGWEYEMYYKTQNTVDYRVLGGMVAGRYVKDQPAHIRCLGNGQDQRFMVNWDEPTGTNVCQVIDLRLCHMDTVIFFPRWVATHPSSTVCFQNHHLHRISALRDAGPVYPLLVLNEHGLIHTVRHVGPCVDSIIS